MTRGGKRKGAGRKTLKDSERRTVTIRARLTYGESMALAELLIRTKQSVRDVLLSALALNGL